jgi:hypothetical protein
MKVEHKTENATMNANVTINRSNEKWNTKPAPWTTDNCVDYIDIIDANKNTIVVVENDNQHNAKLIAAAPELLEALRWYVENDDTNDTAHNEYYLKGLQRAKDAIAKATGE